MTQIVIFQITPYSDEVAAYVNSLSFDQIYSLFGTKASDDILTAALYAVFTLESRQFEQSIIPVINQQRSNILSDRDPIPIYNILDSYSQLYLRDKLLFGENINELDLYPYVFVYVRNGVYAGHVYVWTIRNPNGTGYVTNLVGARSSLHEIFSRGLNILPNLLPTIQQ